MEPAPIAMEVEKAGGEDTGKDLEGKSNNVEIVEAPAAENAEVKADGTEGAEAADAVKEEAPKKMVAPSKLKLRLDDGSLCSFVVESKEVSLLSSDQAHKAGLLKENHLLRMQSFLCEVHAKLPNEGPLKSVTLQNPLSNSKRSFDTEVFEYGVGGGPGGLAGAKKARSLLMGAGTPAGHGTPDAAPQRIGVAANSHDLPSVAKRIFRFIKTKILTPNDLAIFYEPVDDSKFVDYYDVVPHGPMSFSIMEQKLDNNLYESPREFFEDFFKMCDNCHEYNMVVHPEGWHVGRLGRMMEEAFFTAWKKTPLAKHADPDRVPRPIPAEHENPNKPVKPQKPARSSSMPRQASRGHFGGGGAKVYMTAEMENDLVTALNTQEILMANMEQVVGILNAAGEMGTDEDGEPSLDLEKVSAPTKRKLYDLVVGKGKTASGGANPTASGFQMDDDDDFDD